MGDATAEAKRQVELTRSALEKDVDRFVARARQELDWRARLRREAPRIALAAGAVGVLVGGSFAVRQVLKSRRPAKARNLGRGDLAAQVRALREEVEKLRDGERNEPLWLKLALRAGATAAAAGGTYAARQVLQRSPNTSAEGDWPLPPAPKEAGVAG